MYYLQSFWLGYPGYTLLLWPRYTLLLPIFIPLYSIYLMYPGYTWYTLMLPMDTHSYDDPGYTLLVLIYITIPYVLWIHIVMRTLDIHCWCLSISLYLMYSGYTLLWGSWVYIAGTYLYHCTLYTLHIHCYDDPGYTLLVLIYNTLPYVLWIHIVMMTPGIHCWCLSITLYLMYSRYTLLSWPRVYISGAYLYHYTLCTLDTHCYDDPGYT